jgi:hypothetical protein
MFADSCGMSLSRALLSWQSSSLKAIMDNHGINASQPGFTYPVRLSRLIV